MARNLSSTWELAAALALATGGGVMAGLGFLISEEVNASLPNPGDQFSRTDPGHIWPEFHTLPYTYGENDCSWGSLTDPVNLILHGPAASWQTVRDHAALASHGYWAYNRSLVSPAKYFVDHGQCEDFDESSADHGELSTADRFHMRYNQGAGAAPVWGLYTVAAAHHEDFIEFCGGFPNPPGHAVDSPANEPPGGFVVARSELVEKWVVAGDGHLHTHSEYWGNTQRFTQCDGEEAWSDGWVLYVSMPAGGGGGGGGGGGRGFGWF